ncbi:hypothetical protein BDR05DRAFT_978103 [Suillus weaverae]|nr:hypothetical protein BDR05DRAFT_978103 [Suillus weaverae]
MHVSGHHVIGQGSAAIQSTSLAVLDDTSFAFAEYDDSFTMDEIITNSEDVDLPQTRKQTAGDNPLLTWLSEHDSYLSEMIRLDGRGDVGGTCAGCGTAPTLFRCEICDDIQLYCHNCTVTNHLRLPTYHINEWTRVYFKRTSLKNLGLHIQLGHPVGQHCILPHQAFNDDFILIDTDGTVYEIGLDFCATFQVLQQYQILSFESKASAYKFYHTLVRLTDNTGLSKCKDHYEAFMRMVREWRHLKMVKCFGDGHDPDGVNGTLPGECAVLCPACPQPGKNLPDGWQDVGKAKQWLYAIFVAIDANFQLKRCNISSDDTDPSLAKGWAYFVEEKGYKAFLAQHLGDEQEKSTCSSHNAVNMADMKLSQGLAATGVGTVNCACHNMKRPNGVRDLQRGEKYINMDYLFFSTLHGTQLQMLNVSYNIFHLPAHIAKCQTLFSFNFTCFIGRMDGEAPERGWSNINPVASSTKAMGPVCHHNTLDDHFGDWNWKKTVGLGTSLLLKIKDALAKRAEHTMAFEEFDTTITPDHHSTWLAEMEAWEDNPNDTTIPNLFEAKATSIMQAGARLKLAELEAEELHVLIASGIDLEEEQHRLTIAMESLGLHATDTQKSSIVRMRNSLCCKIDMWRHAQILYLPLVQSIINCAAHEVQENAECMKLWLPSQLRDKPCDPRLQNDKWELHYTQAHDMLEEICQCLEWICGQGANTQAQNALARVHGRCTACVKRYRSAWVALKALATVTKKKDWQGRLQELADDDIKPLVDPFITGEGRRHVLWIWMMDGVDCSDEGDNDADVLQGVRIEWCKSRARALQWSEEVELLREEMRRVLRFFTWQAAWWEDQGQRHVGECVTHAEGLQAYAGRQAILRHRMADYFRVLCFCVVPVNRLLAF